MRTRIYFAMLHYSVLIFKSKVSAISSPHPPVGTQAWSPLRGTGWRDGWRLFYESLCNLVHAVGNSSHNIVSETSPGSNAASSCSCSCRGSLYSWGQCCSFMKFNFKQWFLCVFWLLIMFRLKNNDQQTTIRKILNELWTTLFELGLHLI